MNLILILILICCLFITLVYHTDCIDVWLTQNKRDCPICKRKVFTKGETRSQRNRQSSLDSITDTDDDTTPLLQQQSENSSVQSSNVTTTTDHGTFHRNEDVTSDDENSKYCELNLW